MDFAHGPLFVFIGGQLGVVVGPRGRHGASLGQNRIFAVQVGQSRAINDIAERTSPSGNCLISFNRFREWLLQPRQKLAAPFQ